MNLTTIYCWLFNFLTVYTSNMGFVLAFPFVLTFLSTGQSNTEVTGQPTNLCYEMCPRGYYKIGNCNNTVKKYKCEKCPPRSYTDIENYIEECIRCQTCGSDEVEIKPCTFNSNVECECKTKFFYNNKSKVCQPCNCLQCKELSNNDDYNRKCQPCQSCLENEKCKMNCPTTSPVPTPPPPTEGISWLYLVVALVLFVVLLFLLLCIRNSNNCRRWRVNKDLVSPVQDLKFNEQSHHQGSSVNTLILNISEEIPMMSLCQSPAMPEHPAHISPLLPDTQHKATRQDEQSERWPAIVLYSIIKEVPLRRWKEFLRLLSVADQQLERVELEVGLGPGSMERQYLMLRLWSQHSSASLNDVFSALHYMDLSGCAQLLQESLEKLPWKPDLKQGFTACKS